MKQNAILCLTLTLLSGCQGLMHELQPHRLWRLNYSEAPGRTDGVYFSVSDPLDQAPVVQPLTPTPNLHTQPAATQNPAPAAPQ